ncbi:hypothetical protein BRADI_2g43140v3 [Brachypodium distachyon]|uniref:Protein kinase domain-containing protein n=2 Tax=Brachypodium distachyon TaxID=15368 RepID=A0A0Q3GDX6_BRADI|nr:hypothetical protein BRADI_2g43140v3 [Brachypodium distachyon]
MIRPCAAPHEMFRPFPAAPASAELKLSDLDKVGDLGEGACGTVTKVRLRGGSSSAVFALKTAYYPDPNAEEEAEVLRRTSGSPHLVRCHAIFRGAAGEPAMLLELMDAGSLGRVLLARRRAGLPEPALAEVASRCLAGLAHLHSRGVAHLDFKPDNLLANSRGDVKIGDFSESRIFSRTPGERLEVSIAVGSTAYMSPERFAPDARAGPRGACAADVWGLGVTVLELFSGRRPILPDVQRPSWGMLMEAICHGEPPVVPESASSSLRGFVTACLQKDPRRRGTVAQLLAHPFVARRDAGASRRALREIILETM